MILEEIQSMIQFNVRNDLKRGKAKALIDKHRRITQPRVGNYRKPNCHISQIEFQTFRCFTLVLETLQHVKM